MYDRMSKYSIDMAIGDSAMASCCFSSSSQDLFGGEFVKICLSFLVSGFVCYKRSLVL